MLKEWFRTVFGYNAGNDVAGKKLKPYLRDSNACVILRLVLENPGITSGRLAERSRIDRTAVQGYLNGMVLNGLVTVEKEGPGAGYHIAGDAKAAVVEHMPLHYQCPGMMRDDSRLE